MGTDDEQQLLRQSAQHGKRRHPPHVVFDDTGHVPGWAYLVPDAFRPALDVLFTTSTHTAAGLDGKKRRYISQRWTEGNPPAYAFRDHDCIRSRAIVSNLTPSPDAPPDAQPLSVRIIQITQASPDKIVAREISPGTVYFRLFEWQNDEENGRSHYRQLDWYACSQEDFVALLRTGELPDSIRPVQGLS